ncbi:MAG: CAP domain-containing protein [Gemmatales bacterium]|nr:CAP domain-containing protein [Gemmatales bacterium]MDW8386604.1 CAP domain-containing protein [Gemmatales bacterium]
MLLVLGFSPVWFLLPTKEDALRPVLERALRITDEEQELIDLTNQERAKEELRPLKPHPLLMQAAREHAANMARQQKIEHVLDGKEPRDRVRGVGYRFRHLGENVASGYRSPEAVVRGWMSSEGHRGNILRAEFTEIGVGVVRDHSGKPYYAQVLASPK